jgi:hypothetical protein
MMSQFPTHLIDIERRLWTNDAAFYQDNLTEDCLLVFAETGVITREIAVNAIRKENQQGRRWAEVNFDEIRQLRLTDAVSLLNYRVNARWEHEESSVTLLASSIYVRRDEVWKLALHQQTPVVKE